MLVKRKMQRKGIFFTAVFIVLVAVMLITVSLWAEQGKVRERRMPQAIKVDSLSFLQRQITDEKLSNFSSVALYGAFTQLARDEIENNRGIPGNEEDVLDAAKELFLEGSADTGEFESAYDEAGMRSFSLAGWMESMHASANEMGFVISFGEVENVEIRAVDAWRVSVSYDLPMNITDFEGKLFISKRLHAQSEVFIDGIPDPLIGREIQGLALGEQEPIYRTFMHREDLDTLAEADVELLASEGENSLDNGEGWILGTVLADPQAEVSGAKIWITEYVVPNDAAGQAEFNRNRAEANAYIITRTDFGGDVGGKPFVSGNVHVEPGKEVLIVSSGRGEDADYRIYDMAGLRELIKCQTYVQNPDAPSFLQRFLASGIGMEGGERGIETLLVGTAYRGVTDIERLQAEHDSWSRVDHEYLSGTSGRIVKGGSGCKTIGMCNEDEDQESPVGKFRMDSGHFEEYGIDEIMLCPEGGRCE